MFILFEGVDCTFYCIIYFVLSNIQVDQVKYIYIYMILILLLSQQPGDSQKYPLRIRGRFIKAKTRVWRGLSIGLITTSTPFLRFRTLHKHT